MRRINEPIDDSVGERKDRLPKSYTWGKIIALGVACAEQKERSRQKKVIRADGESVQ